MNILLIGGANSLINSLINKLNKEGHRVCLLTGSAYKRQGYARVFETYNFPYSSVSLCDVFESINPEVTIYTGAYDSNYSWENEERESVTFTSCLINILMAYSTVKKGRFLFLSSEEVYGSGHSDAVEEGEPTNPRTLRGMALAQGEELCDNYRRTRELDIVVARLDHLYNIPQTLEDVNNLCAKMCLEALNSGVIAINPKDTGAFLYEADAVEYIYRLVAGAEHRESLYHISPSASVSYLELAGMVQRHMGRDKKPKADESGDSELPYAELNGGAGGGRY